MTVIQKLGRSPTFWGGLAVIFSYWVWGPLIPADTRAEYLRVFGIVYAGFAFMAYLPGVVKFLTEKTPVEAQQLVMGIVVLALSLVCGGIWLLIWRQAGQPYWMVNSDINGFWLWLVVVGYFLHITAPRVLEGEIPRPNWSRVWVAFLVATALSLLIVHIRPDMAALAEWMRPYLSNLPAGRGPPT